MYLGIVITRNDLFSPRCRLTTEHATLTHVQTHTDPHIYIFMRTARITLQYPAPEPSPINPNKLPQRPLNVYLPHIHAEVWKVFEGSFFVAARSHLPVSVVFIREMEV